MGTSKLDKRTLNFKLWSYFIAFASVIIVILWLLQIVFINSFYENMKMREIKKIGDQLLGQYNSEEFENQLVEKAFLEGISINILDETGRLIFPLDFFDIIRQPRLESNMFSELLTNLYKSDDKTTLYTRSDHRIEYPILTYGAILENEQGSNYFLYINTILDPIDSTVNVLQNQLVIITILSLFLAIGLSYIISRKLSNPIVRITDQAKKLMMGNYNIQFDKGYYTEIDNLAETLNKTAKELNKTEELRQDLMANMTHDLKTPLTLIKSYGEMIRDISGDDKVKRDYHVGIIIDETDRLTHFVDDMLDLSKVQSGLITLELSTIDLYQCAKKVLGRFEYFVEQENFDIKLIHSGNTTILGDESKVIQAIYNLIINGINYSNDYKEIEIKVEEKDEWVSISVKDRGEGIPKDEINLIWDRYYRGGKSHVRGKAGTGIGLSIVKSIVTALGGRCFVESEIGKGSTFTLQFKKSIS